jgi:hypothetical protein
MNPTPSVDTSLFDPGLINPDLVNQTSAPFIERLGYYPATLAAFALLFGLLAILIRKRRMNIASGIAIFATVCAGLGTTAWRQYQVSSVMSPGVFPLQQQLDFSQAWLATGVVLPAAGFGLFLVALAWLFTRPPNLLG